ncbi:ABC transporter substrate-binding protein [Chelativorans sp. AA-79]|uniref:ABC transporter substrate-binding protein n=1 Tax=Chelativorans sp. AA-79 TaxID=3028735 RepID=UPI0023F68E28|nr:ABC transporter substrate-binding protein [Chelativorans sp. AA-79]WEX12060.1 ABC transporter substrate-binding protein [Chelativorans sp. AA-79]
MIYFFKSYPRVAGAVLTRFASGEEAHRGPLIAGALAAAVLAAQPAWAQDGPAIKFQVYQGGPQILPLIAQEQKFFEANNVNVEFITVQTGPQAANALVSGSIDLAILSPLNVAPLLAEGIELSAVSGLQKVFVSLVGSKGAETGWPQSLEALRGKSIGILALGAAGHMICEEALRAAGLSSSDYTFVSTGTELGTGTALEQGAIDAGCMNPQTRIPLTTKGFPVLFNYLEPEMDEDEYPETFRPILNLSFVQLWGRSDWVNDNQDKVETLVEALAKANVWMNDPKNFQAIADTVRGSIYDIPSFEGEQFDSYIRSLIQAHRLLFTQDDGETWKDVVKSSMSLDIPDWTEWVAESAPGSEEELSVLAQEQ